MANEMPSSKDFSGLSRKVIQYSEEFNAIVQKAKQGKVSPADWVAMEELVDTENFERVGVFTSGKTEVINWATYKGYVSEYAGATQWEGTLRRVTEVPGTVFLELVERNTRGGNTHTTNTMTVYDFNSAGKLKHLEVYVMP